MTAVLWEISSEISKPLVFYLLCEVYFQSLGLQVFVNWPSGSDPVLRTGDRMMDETDKVPFLMELIF